MPKLTIYNIDILSSLSLPFADEGIRAGFPSPAQGHMDRSIDLNSDLVSNPDSTFYARVEGDSMIEANLNQGDILVVDRSLRPSDGDIVVCVVEGEFTVKYIDIHPDHIVLRPANPAYRPLRIDDPYSVEVWGVVTYVIHATRHK
ncbi:MAG: translesion error-prone DNA polymerase V autoproteolytic subunit [Bacteroidaceae bacterium]|mgnify:FL=1|nr:translesion error-prone DNA polymerase V autoproteolytic subunit [Bacteroidaceae bacterium]